MKLIYTLPYGKQKALEAINKAGDGYTVTIEEPKRSLDQNKKMWALLGEVSEQVVWHGLKLTPENWKDIFTASLRKQQVVPGIDGSFVVLGASTSKMTKLELSDLIELIYAFGGEKEVKFGDL
jgi:hypothetical protein